MSQQTLTVNLIFFLIFMIYENELQTCFILPVLCQYITIYKLKGVIKL
jgi:hypothetical protein